VTAKGLENLKGSRDVKNDPVAWAAAGQGIVWVRPDSGTGRRE
jgi:hypothetical protein